MVYFQYDFKAINIFFSILGLLSEQKIVILFLLHSFIRRMISRDIYIFKHYLNYPPELLGI